MNQTDEFNKEHQTSSGMESEKLEVSWGRSEFQPQLGTGYSGVGAKILPSLGLSFPIDEMVGTRFIYSADVITETHFANTQAA